MADAPWPRCEKCGVVRPPHALEPKGSGLVCKDGHLCCALRTGDVGTEGTQPQPGPNDGPEEETTDVTPPGSTNGVPKPH